MKLNLQSKTLKFSVSGLRGVYPDDLNPENIPSLVAAYHKTIGSGDIAIARDTRPTGAAIEKLVEGTLTALGRNVHMLGIVPTPTIKAYVAEKKLAGAIMISASHNPVQYNAFKFIQKGGFFFDEEKNRLWLNFLNEKLSWGSYQKQGKSIDAHKEAIQLHIQYVIKRVFPDLKTVKNKKNIRVALDTLGACATEIIPEMLKELGIQYEMLFPDFENNFPRPPEPVEASLSKLKKLVREKKCDLGLAYDPDADRLALVDNEGNAIGEELTLPLSMMQALGEKKGAVVVNLSSSYYNNHVATQMGCKIIRSKVGEAHVVTSMLKNRAVFGGEGNGGVIDPLIPSLGRDSISGTAWILSLLLESKKSVTEIVDTLPRYYMKKIALKCEKKEFDQLVKKIENIRTDWIINKLDGYHFSAKEGLPWIHLRSSNTEPIVRIIIETSSKNELKSLLQKIE